MREERPVRGEVPSHARRKQPRRRRGIWGVLIVLLLLVVLALAGALLYLNMEREEPVVETDPAEGLYGSWQTTYSLKSAAVQNAGEWLGHGMDMGDYLPELGISVTLTLNPNGSWSRSLSETDYAEADLQAQNALATALTDLVVLRLRAAGVGVDVAALTRQAIDSPEGGAVTAEVSGSGHTGTEQERATAAAYITQTVGMSPDQYIRTLGLALLPPLEQLQTELNGTGSFTADGHFLTLAQGDGTSLTFGYLTDENSLVFTNDAAGSSTPTLFTLLARAA